jgi:2,4-dienoyl-CoA reductase (NADPH2)
MNPKENAGGFPMEEFRLFYDLNRHPSRKAAVRAAIAHAVPLSVWRWTSGRAWRFQPAFNLDDTRAFKQAVGIPVIANGGFQERSLVEDALTSGNRCAARTAGFPLGCYEPKRFRSLEEMEQQILAWSTPSAAAVEGDGARARAEQATHPA